MPPRPQRDAPAAGVAPLGLLAALADATRQRILQELTARHRATATDLAADLPVSRQAVVKHLATLHRAGLVVPRNRGRAVEYQVEPARLRDAARWLDDVAARWEQRLEALKRLAEDGDEG